ncbi:energy-coupled thiamine transporter ThiT [Candidatus Atribacteria bacterium 1244-E10-H5-B2]|nr:MAG: energy-coupled thiamine transporter ThiT [Candidatus Atribacteria bacterium 1244-E10-H5-B2]
MKGNQVKIMTEVGMAVALSVILNFIPLWRMPQGGSISLEMLPILIIALRWGVSPGMMAGVVYGLVQLAFGPFIIHPAQLVLDYPLPYMLVGLAGIFSNKIDLKAKGSTYGWLLLAVFTGGLGRFVSHFFSGVIFFAQYAPEGQSPWVYSAIYNISYLLPALLLSYVIIIPLIKILVISEGENQR